LTAPDRLSRALADRYRIERELGQGGMATVHLAEDLKHNRKVAIKVLRPELAAVLGAERFVQEITTTAQLQHPNILPLFDSGSADGFLYYVMPYVEGETLRARLNRETQLGVEESVALVREVADALQYAHTQGVVHRDIKPENILLHAGRPMVADFGIALAVSAAAGGRMTETGLSLGTPHYMSPEQATAEKHITNRSDIYSLGAVLYEMLTGEPPHTGTSAQQIIMKIITEPVAPVTERRRTVPPNVAAALAKALEKLPADRFGTAAEFAAALQDATFVPRTAGRGGVRASTVRRAPVGWAMGAGAVIGALVLGWFAHGWLTRPPLVAPVHFAFTLGHPGVVRGFVAISPDGRRIAMSVMDSAGVQHIGERALGSTAVTLIPGTGGGDNPTYSLDGKWIAFSRAFGGGLLKVPSPGGTPTVVVDSGVGDPVAWLPDGSLVASTMALEEFPASGGPPVPLTQLDTARHEFAHFAPRLLPDGHTLIFNAYATPLSQSRIEAYDLKTHKQAVLVENAIFPRYVPGYLLFARDGAIFAVRFDPATLSVTGTAVPVQDDVAWRPTDGIAGYDVAPNGTLVYVSASAWNVPHEVVWMDRTGQATRALPDTGSWAEPRISPDGRLISVSVLQPRSAIWVYDVARKALSPVTHAPGVAFNGIWAPDSRRLVYSYEDPVYDLHEISVDGSTPDRAVVNSQRDKVATSVSPDGRQLLYIVNTRPDWIMVASLGDTAAPHRLFPDARGRQEDAVFSPDGRWVAYEERNGNRSDVYVRAADGSGARHPVSSTGGVEPRWTRGGREIVYRDGAAIMAAPVNPTTGDAGAPALLFHAPVLERQFQRAASYDVTPDGQRFLIVRPVERSDAPAVNVVVNWLSVLTEKMKQ
jgi:Tol biopolymer transport system component